MATEIPWFVWLIAGLVVGTIGGVGTSGVLGVAMAIAVIGAPIYIFLTVGAHILPFVLFFGGLTAATAFFHRRRAAAENRKRRDDIAEKRREMGLH